MMIRSHLPAAHQEVQILYDHAVINNIEHNRMAKTTDIEKMKLQVAKLQEAIAFQEATQSKFISIAAAIKKQVADAGLDLADVLPHLKAPRKARAAKGTAVKKAPESLDSDGKMPTRGTTYKHSSWPSTWTAEGKRTPGHVLKTVKGGKTWVELKVK